MVGLCSSYEKLYIKLYIATVHHKPLFYQSFPTSCSLAPLLSLACIQAPQAPEHKWQRPPGSASSPICAALLAAPLEQTTGAGGFT